MIALEKGGIVQDQKMHHWKMIALEKGGKWDISVILSLFWECGVSYEPSWPGHLGFEQKKPDLETLNPYKP